MVNNNEHDLVIERSLKATPSQVWRAWSDPKLLSEWWCPKPWMTEVRSFNFKSGGDFHTFMRGPDGGESDNPGSFLEIIPQEKIVFTSMLTGGWRPTSPWIGITGIFTMVGESNGTRYSVRCLHRDADESKKHVDMGFYEGWGTCITQLDEFASKL